MQLKKYLVWIVVLTVALGGGFFVWMKAKIDDAPEVIEDPGIPENLEIPEEIPIE